MSETAEYREALAELGRAVRKFRDTIAPGMYVDEWLVVTHNLSPELEQRASSQVSIAVAEDQSFVVTRGMLELALDSTKAHNHAT